LHRHGLLPSIFQPDEATQTLRDYVRQRANLVRLSGQHIQRMQKALGLMNLKLTTVLEDITGVTGLKILRAILAGERDPRVLAKLRDKRCQRKESEIATALDGRYRAEHVLELRCCLAMWEKYQEMIGVVDESIAGQLQKMKKQSLLPPLPPKKRVRGKRPHDPRFDVRTALYLVRGVDLTKWPSVKGRAAHTLRLAAWSLMRSKSYRGAYLRRQRSRLGSPKAITATAHKLARTLYHLLRHGEAYVQQEEAAYARQVRERLEKQLHRRARELGYELKKVGS